MEGWSRFQIVNLNHINPYRKATIKLGAADAKYDLRGRWDRADLPGKLVAFDAKHDVRGKARQLGVLMIETVWKPMVQLWGKVLAMLEEKGITAKASEYWVASGIPAWIEKQLEAWEANQEMRQRMKGVDMKEAKGESLD